MKTKDCETIVTKRPCVSSLELNEVIAILLDHAGIAKWGNGQMRVLERLGEWLRPFSRGRRRFPRG
jgi:hypothetical protein